MFSRIATILLQIILTYSAAAASFAALPLGEGWELPWLAGISTLIVWLVGWIMSILPSLSPPRLAHFILTGIGAALGVATILLTPAIGALQIIFPSLGALIGYYLSKALFRDE